MPIRLDLSMTYLPLWRFTKLSKLLCHTHTHACLPHPHRKPTVLCPSACISSFFTKHLPENSTSRPTALSRSLVLSYITIQIMDNLSPTSSCIHCNPCIHVSITVAPPVKFLLLGLAWVKILQGSRFNPYNRWFSRCKDRYFSFISLLFPIVGNTKRKRVQNATLHFVLVIIKLNL